MMTPERQSGWCIGFRKVHASVIPAKLNREREPESTKTGFPLSRERRTGHFSDERSSHPEKSSGRQSGKILENQLAEARDSRLRQPILIWPRYVW